MGSLEDVDGDVASAEGGLTNKINDVDSTVRIKHYNLHTTFFFFYPRLKTETECLTLQSSAMTAFTNIYDLIDIG